MAIHAGGIRPVHSGGRRVRREGGMTHMGLFTMVGGFFRGVWRALDGVRKVLHLILLLVLFGIVIAATRSSLPYVPGKAALVLAPEGRIVEELSGDALDRALFEAAGERQPETRLQDLLDVVKAAADDDRVQALVLDLGALERAGLPALQDLGRAIAEFRKSGKKVLAWGAWYDQRHYYLAAHPDEVYLDPFGAVVVEGYSYFRQYLKGTADKLGVDVHVFKVGTHKSAPESYTRSDMSPEDREEATVWIGALWTAWKDDVAAARKLEPAALQAYADRAGEGARQAEGDLAQYALGRGLVDGLKTREQFDERVSEEVGEDEEERYTVPHNSPCFKPPLWWASAAAAAAWATALTLKGWRTRLRRSATSGRETE